jgi:lipoprotein-releasing system permease protein
MLFLAVRQLLSRKRQTVLILLGIALGTMMYVVISGIQLGMRDYFTGKLLNNNPHIRITAPDEMIEEAAVRERMYGNRAVRWITPPSGKREEGRIEYPQGWFERFRNDPEVVAYSPSLVVNVIASRAKFKQSAALNGVIPERYRMVSQLDESMVSGKLMDLSGAGGKLIAGQELLDRIGARVGESVRITIGTGDPRPFKVVGAFRFGNEQLDQTLLFAHLSDVQQLNRTPGRIGLIGVDLVDMDDATRVAAGWKLGTRDKVESWQETFSNLFEVFRVQDVTRWTICIAMLVVAGFGVYNVLSIMITQKRREIAILRSIGYPPGRILSLFMIQGAFLGVSGATVGLVLGYWANVGISRVRISSGPHSMGMTHLIVSQDPSNYAIAFAMAVASALVAALLPARQASRMTPIDIIRSS